MELETEEQCAYQRRRRTLACR
ncbi:uncharacterized protein G2W53_009352 [Senna tora]|uniref:Uncharacterized protein n=1 Tax=Senna tora TaxID=362788 RepID=A0A834WYU3_9FABA|nr:uncharacterized protein G2W53_009352 [Senna tora]